MSEELKKLKGHLVHYSTDYVFDGNHPIENFSGWLETDTTNPLNVYGQSKLDGEKAIQSSGVSHFIFRFSWVYGSRGSNFLKTMLRLAETKPQLSVVADQLGAPTWSRQIAQATTIALAQADFKDHSGLYHMGSAGSTSWQGFAQEIFNLSNGPRPEVFSIPTSQYPTPARRPLNSILNSDKLEAHFGIRLPSWKQQLQQVMGQ